MRIMLSTHSATMAARSLIHRDADRSTVHDKFRPRRRWSRIILDEVKTRATRDNLNNVDKFTSFWEGEGGRNAETRKIAISLSAGGRNTSARRL